MYLCPTYILAVVFCVVTMFCWGSWANAQKLVSKKWRYELFYWDYTIGVLVTSLIFAYTMGSSGSQLGRGFITDFTQAAPSALLWAFAGGVVFNVANILLVSAIDIAGLSVAFPVGIGLALVLGVIWNFLAAPTASGNPVLLFLGVGLVAIAIILSALSYKKRDEAVTDPSAPKKAIGKGLALSLLCGVLMSLFYFFVVKSLAQVVTGAAPGETFEVTLANLSVDGARLENGKLTPYTANVLFALGVFISTFIVMPILMRKPIVGEPVPKGAYFSGAMRDHFWGWIGGAVWAIGMTLNVIASGVASAAIAYGLGQGATLMSAIWGVFIWREFKGAPKGVTKILTAMFLFFVVGLGLIIWTKLDAPEPKLPPSRASMGVEAAIPTDIPDFEQLIEGFSADLKPIEEALGFGDDAEKTNEAVDELIEESFDDPADELIDELFDDPLDELVEEPADDPLDELVEEPADDPLDELIEEPADDPLDELIEEPADDPLDELIEEPADDPLDELVEEPVDDSLDELVEEPVEELIEEPVEDAVEETVELDLPEE